MIDGILSFEPSTLIVAVKNVALGESFFLGHFPGHPIMPGVLIVEAMAQAAGVLVWESLPPEERNFILYLVSVENSRFKEPVCPGDRLVLTAELILRRRNFWRFKATAKVDGHTVAHSEFLQAPGKIL
jgi:3-hydroxyacyl-[acyl-carrier-protein] dehydratase